MASEVSCAKTCVQEVPTGVVRGTPEEGHEPSLSLSSSQSLSDSQNFLFLTHEDFSYGLFENASFYHHLTKEIENVSKKIQEHLQKLKSYRTKLVILLEQGITKHFAPKKVSVEMYGSMKNTLAIEHSDIDLRVIGVNLSGLEEMKAAIKLLERKLRTVKSVKSTASILTARVPVIKLVRYSEYVLDSRLRCVRRGFPI